MFPPKSGTRCRFRLSDVICPDKQQIVTQITPELEVAGEVVLLSDGGDKPEQYAIIEVEGIGAPLIVPVALLKDAQIPVEQGVSEKPAQLDTRYEKVGKS
jgi:hypothetical protein